MIVAHVVVSISERVNGGSSMKFEAMFKPIGSMYGIYANSWDILMVNVSIYCIHGSYGKGNREIMGFDISTSQLCHAYIVCQ